MLQHNSTDDARSLDQRSTPARKSRPAVTQPAYFRLTRVDTTRSTSPRPSSGQRSGGLDDGCGRRFTLPLDKTLPISAEDVGDGCARGNLGADLHDLSGHATADDACHHTVALVEGQELATVVLDDVHDVVGLGLAEALDLH